MFLFISVASNSKANQNQMNNNNQAPKPPPKKSVSMRDESMPDVGREVWVNFKRPISVSRGITLKTMIFFGLCPNPHVDIINATVTPLLVLKVLLSIWKDAFTYVSFQPTTHSNEKWPSRNGACASWPRLWEDWWVWEREIFWSKT